MKFLFIPHVAIIRQREEANLIWKTMIWIGYFQCFLIHYYYYTGCKPVISVPIKAQFNNDCHWCCWPTVQGAGGNWTTVSWWRISTEQGAVILYEVVKSSREVQYKIWMCPVLMWDNQRDQPNCLNLLWHNASKTRERWVECGATSEGAVELSLG